MVKCFDRVCKEHFNNYKIMNALYIAKFKIRHFKLK